MTAVRPNTCPSGWTIKSAMGITTVIANRVSCSLGILGGPDPRSLALWPLFHYLLWQDVVTEYASADQHYPYYEAANAGFARKIAEVYRPGDLIWVHDYHLLLVPR